METLLLQIQVMYSCVNRTLFTFFVGSHAVRQISLTAICGRSKPE